MSAAADEVRSEVRRIAVRPATAFDVVNIARLVKEMFAESKSPLTSVVDVNLVRWVAYIVAKEFCAVAELNGRLMGVTGFSAFTPPWGDETLMMLDFFYVTPAFRAHGTSEALLDLVERWAKSRKLRIYGTILNGTYSGAVNKRINEGGYHKVGLTFLKDCGDAKWDS